MADLLESEYNEIRLRRGVQDLDTLIGLLVEDGEIIVVPDPEAETAAKPKARAKKKSSAKK